MFFCRDHFGHEQSITGMVAFLIGHLTMECSDMLQCAQLDLLRQNLAVFSSM